MAEVQDATNVGKPVPIVLAKKNHHFVLDEEALKSILLKDDIKDLNVVVVSVAGSYRKGKSFLMDFVLRYMKATYHLNLTNEDAHWIGSNDKPLDGFSWRGGSNRPGILMWSEVFKATLDDGEKVAIVLLDTPGTFDSGSKVKDCATVFALSTLLSSIQIYNLKFNKLADDLQHILQLFTEYGRLALEDSGTKPFQKLQFLVRDWNFPNDAKYGAEGGKKILDKRLQILDKQHKSKKTLRKHIKSCFSDIGCYLMPHPGRNVATNRNFDGKLSEFKKHIITLIPMLLSPNQLILKEIGGQKIKAKELVHYFKAYIKLCTGAEIPEPKSMFDATAEANNLSAVASAREVYCSMMDTICSYDRPGLSSKSLKVKHLKNKDIAIAQFIAKRKMGGDEFSKYYKIKLKNDIQKDFFKFQSKNEINNFLESARTPAVFFSVAVVCFFIFGIYTEGANDYDQEEYDYQSTEDVENEMPIEEDEPEVGIQEEDGNQQKEPETVPFQYKPSKRVEEMENNMPDSAKVFIGVGKLKDTMIDTYASAMATDEAKAGFANANHEWQLLLEGPEAARVFGTSGQNFNTIVTSTDGADMINMLATTVHVLLAKAGEQKMSSGLRDILSMTYSLFTSPNMPEIVNKTGGLVITTANKPGAPLFTKTYWDETKKLLSDKNLNEKLKKYFANIMSMMKQLSGMMKGGKQLLNNRGRRA